MRKRLNIIHLSGILILIFIAFFIANNNPFIKIINQNTSKTILDMSFNSTTKYIYGYFDDLGETGREAYRNFLLMIDMIFPIVYSTLFFFILLFIKQRINKTNKIIDMFVFFPFLCGLLDIIENIHILILLINYPNILNLTSKSLSLFTSIKTISGILYIMIFIYFIIVLIANRKKMSST